jgi:hypothetical protein
MKLEAQKSACEAGACTYEPYDIFFIQRCDVCELQLMNWSLEMLFNVSEIPCKTKRDFGNAFSSMSALELQQN